MTTPKSIPGTIAAETEDVLGFLPRWSKIVIFMFALPFGFYAAATYFIPRNAVITENQTETIGDAVAEEIRTQVATRVGAEVEAKLRPIAAQLSELTDVNRRVGEIATHMGSVDANVSGIRESMEVIRTIATQAITDNIKQDARIRSLEDGHAVTVRAADDMRSLIQRQGFQIQTLLERVGLSLGPPFLERPPTDEEMAHEALELAPYIGM